LYRYFDRKLVVSIFLAAIWISGQAQDNVLVIPATDQTVTVDGILDEEMWKNALRIEGFYTYYPVDGNESPEKTVAFLTYDESSLYVAFICLDKMTNLIRANVSMRDQILDDDHVVLFLDTFNSGKESFEFCFNPLGIQQDGIYIDMVSQDFTPDFLYYSKGQLFKEGYIIEAEIPFKSLRFPSGSDVTFGFCIMRSVKHLEQEFIYPKISRNSTTFIPQFAKLSGFKNVSPGNNIELLPEFTSSWQNHFEPDQNQLVSEAVKFNGGINLKYGPRSNITFDFTLNPDFSQVEADADKIDINRRFPLYFTEKRPFFLESTNIFQSPINVLYTRRIVDPIAGLKFTGKSGGYELGILQGVDDYYGSEEYLQETALLQKYYYDPAFDDSAFIKKYNNKKSVHSVVRIKKNLWNYSQIGGMFSDFRHYDTYSTTYGIDGSFLLFNEYFLTFQALNSNTQDYFDTTAVQDPAFHFNLFRGSSTFNFQLSYNDVYPEFEVANGFLERKDYREGSIQMWYDWRQSESFFGLIQPSIYYTQMYNHDGRKIESYIGPSLNFETKGNNTLSLRYYQQFEEYAGYDFNKDWYYIQFTNKTFSWLFFDTELFFGDAIYYDALYYGLPPFLGKFRSLDADIDLRPMNNWSILFGLRNYLFDGNYQGEQYKTKQDIYRFRMTYQFTREIGLRFIVQHNNYYKDIDINTLISYQPFPGTVFFLGYNDFLNQINIDNPKPKYRSTEQGLFVKISYLFRF
jgi:hypothetical protein